MKLKVKTDYANQTAFYAKGSTIEVQPDEAVWLMADSPGTFEEVKPATTKRTPKGESDEKK